MIDWNGLTPEEQKRHNRRRAAFAAKRVASKCAEGHDLTDIGKPTEGCRRCGYYTCELRAWGLT